MYCLASKAGAAASAWTILPSLLLDDWACAGDGELYTSGANNEGQLGVRGHSTAQTPVRVAGLEAHTAHCIACGESHMLAVIDSGSLAAWGSNEYGQLGVQASVLRKTESILQWHRSDA